MQKSVKNTTVAVLCFLFILSAVASSQSISITNEETAEKVSSLPEELTKTVTLYRCGPDGTVKPQQYTIVLKDGQELGEAIAEKCEELMENDVEIQDFLKETLEVTSDSNLAFGILSFVKSHGRGFHFKMKMRMKLKMVLKLFAIRLPKIRVRCRIPLMFCSYANDTKANTTITPLLSLNNSRIIDGNHSVFVRSFIGFTSWIGRFSISPFDLLPRGFFGFARYVICVRS
jgi:hypothetical protein